MRRTYFVLMALLGVALLLWKFSTTERPTPQQNQTNSTTALKTLLKPRVVAQRPVGPSNPGTNSVTEGDQEPATLSPEQIAAYLAKYKRNAESLLSAFAECHDKALLKEAAEKFPNDPRVQLAVLMQDKGDNQLTAEERNLWIDRFKKDSPENGLPNLLAALEKFKSGQTDLGVAEVTSAKDKGGLSAFYVEQLQSREEMYLSAGLSPQEAREKAMQRLDISVDATMKALAQRLGDTQKNYVTAGDTASANKMAGLGVNLGQRWADPNSSPFVISELVGIAMQTISLRNLDPNTYYDFLGKTAGERIAELKAERQETKTLVSDLSKLYAQMTESDKMVYMDRMKIYGERNAWKWLRQTYGTNGGTAQP